MARPNHNGRQRRTEAGGENLSHGQLTNFSDLTHLQTSLEPLFEAGSKMLENWRAMSEEIIEFGKARLSRNLEATQKVARSSSLDQAIEAQTEFARAMMQDYLAEVSRLTDLGTKAMLGGWSALQTEHRQPQRGVETAHRANERLAAE